MALSDFGTYYTPKSDIITLGVAVENVSRKAAEKYGSQFGYGHFEVEFSTFADDAADNAPNAEWQLDQVAIDYLDFVKNVTLVYHEPDCNYSEDFKTYDLREIGTWPMLKNMVERMFPYIPEKERAKIAIDIKNEYFK